MVPADSDRISRVPPYSGYFNESQIFRLQDFHLLRFSFPTNSAILKISYSYIKVLQPLSVDRFGLFPFRSPLLRESIFFFLFLRLLRCFSSPGIASYTLCIHYTTIPHYWYQVPPFGNLRIKATYSSPKHIVVRHVLHQLLVPRHSPCALSNLTTICLIFYILI